MHIMVRQSKFMLNYCPCTQFFEPHLPLTAYMTFYHEPLSYMHTLCQPVIVHCLHVPHVFTVKALNKHLSGNLNRSIYVVSYCIKIYIFISDFYNTPNTECHNSKLLYCNDQRYHFGVLQQIFVTFGNMLYISILIYIYTCLLVCNTVII